MHEAVPKILSHFNEPSRLGTSMALGRAAVAAFSVRAARTVRISRSDVAIEKKSQIDLMLKGRDPLTKLDGLSGLQTAVGNSFAIPGPSALIMLRIDNLRPIIASQGHSAGESLLISVAERLKKLWPTVRWSRLVGDDFGFVLKGVHTDSQLEEAALVILRSVEQPVQTLQGDFVCSASLGIARILGQAVRSENSVAGVLLAAFSALGDASAAGGSQWSIYDTKRDRADALRSSTKEELHAAIESGQIVPHYQPIVDLRNGQIVGLEVLARWEHPTRGILPPDLFIPMAEEMQLAGRISHFLMRRVVAESRQWPTHLYFAFNASPGQLREVIDLVTTSRPWPEGALDPKRLEIEITESALIEDLEVARTVIEVLQAAGTRVVLDDFGIGYSNFFHLRELPFDKIKIDKSFVLDLGLDPRADACVKTMIALGKSLDIEMVAEGLEKDGIADYLAELGCRYGQGYLYSGPVPAEVISKLLRNRIITGGASVTG